MYRPIQLTVENKTKSDQQLWLECRTNDRKAFEMLFNRFAPKLLKQTLGYISNAMVAEELVMDLMLEIWNKRHDGIMLGEVSPYLFRCMRNKILMHLRKNIPETLDIQKVDNNNVIEPIPADYKISNLENKLVIDKAVSRLSPKRQLIFRLIIEENLTCSQIAKKLNLSTSTVENHLYDSRKFLKKIL